MGPRGFHIKGVTIAGWLHVHIDIIILQLVYTVPWINKELVSIKVSKY